MHPHETIAILDARIKSVTPRVFEEVAATVDNSPASAAAQILGREIIRLGLCSEMVRDRGCIGRKPLFGIAHAFTRAEYTNALAKGAVGHPERKLLFSVAARLYHDDLLTLNRTTSQYMHILYNAFYPNGILPDRDSATHQYPPLPLSLDKDPTAVQFASAVQGTVTLPFPILSQQFREDTDLAHQTRSTFYELGVLGFGVLVSDVLQRMESELGGIPPQAIVGLLNSDISKYGMHPTPNATLRRLRPPTQLTNTAVRARVLSEDFNVVIGRAMVAIDGYQRMRDWFQKSTHDSDFYHSRPATPMAQAGALISVTPATPRALPSPANSIVSLQSAFSSASSSTDRASDHSYSTSSRPSQRRESFHHRTSTTRLGKGFGASKYSQVAKGDRDIPFDKLPQSLPVTPLQRRSVQLPPVPLSATSTPSMGPPSELPHLPFPRGGETSGRTLGEVGGTPQSGSSLGLFDPNGAVLPRPESEVDRYRRTLDVAAGANSGARSSTPASSSTLPSSILTDHVAPQVLADARLQDTIVSHMGPLPESTLESIVDVMAMFLSNTHLASAWEESKTWPVYSREELEEDWRGVWG